MLAFPWIMKKMGTMSEMVDVFACAGITGYVIIFLSGAFLLGLLLGNLLGPFAGLRQLTTILSRFICHDLHEYLLLHSTSFHIFYSPFCF